MWLRHSPTGGIRPSRTEHSVSLHAGPLTWQYGCVDVTVIGHWYRQYQIAYGGILPPNPGTCIRRTNIYTLLDMQLPDLDTSEQAYLLAREAYEADGRQILDATVGGKLMIFSKVDFISLF